MFLWLARSLFVSRILCQKCKIASERMFCILMKCRPTKEGWIKFKWEWTHRKRYSINFNWPAIHWLDLICVFGKFLISGNSRRAIYSPFYQIKKNVINWWLRFNYYLGRTLNRLTIDKLIARLSIDKNRFIKFQQDDVLLAHSKQKQMRQSKLKWLKITWIQFNQLLKCEKSHLLLAYKLRIFYCDFDL